MINTGTGSFAPLDSDEFVEITLTVEAGNIANAEFACSNGPRVEDCARSLCGLMIGFPVNDIFQINNNAVYFNLEKPLERDKLYCASIAVIAAKKAALDYYKRNGLPTDGIVGLCDCFDN